ncbi:MAG: hypothetical protein ABI346_04570 [Candidatus Baltobacteraceae bacterium]
MLLLGAGRGRNLAPLLRAGAAVDARDADADIGRLPPGGFDAVLTTHALLHGEPATVAARLEALGSTLVDGGLLYATFGSCADPRYGRGDRTAGGAWAERDGPEAGVAHAYFTRSALRAMLQAHFTLELLREREVGAMVGRWAHAAAPPGQRVHWFVAAHVERGGDVD